MEWDEPGCGDKQNRVSVWEIETPESLFIFPSLTSSLKRPLQSGYYGKSLFLYFFSFLGNENLIFDDWLCLLV